MEGCAKRLELLANFWQVAFLEQAPGREKVKIAAYLLVIEWWAWVDLNHRPRPYQYCGR
jgi:hypothetical protein